MCNSSDCNHKPGNTGRQDYFHPHVHSHFSVQDALATPEQMAMTARKKGFPGLAITDHGRMNGVVEHVDACRKSKDDLLPIKPVIGVEAYTTPDHRARGNVLRPDGTMGRPKHPHLTLLAQNQRGYENLSVLSTIAADPENGGYYYDPCIDRSLLEAHSEGVIVLSGCISSELSQALLRGEDDRARSIVSYYKDVFGKNYWGELMWHGHEEQQIVCEKLVPLMREMDVPLVCSNDVHYADRMDWQTHDILIQMRDLRELKGGSLKDYVPTGKMEAYGTHNFHLRTEAEMRAIFDHLAPEAVPNSLRLLDSIEDFFVLDPDPFLPKAKIPTDNEDFNRWRGLHLPHQPVDEAYLAYLAFRGLERKGLAKYKRYMDRLMYELQAIWSLGVTNYLLLEVQIAEYMRSSGTLFNIRGSGVGCLALFALGISSPVADPVKYGLMFERFLNPGRGKQVKLTFSEHPAKDWLAAHPDRDQTASIKRLRALMEEKAADPAWAHIGPDFAKEVWFLEMQGLAAYITDLSDRGVTVRENESQLWSAYFLGITDKRPDGPLIVSKTATQPDVDNDIASDRRGGVIQFCRDAFRDDHVSIIGATQTYALKAAIQDNLKIDPDFVEAYGDEVAQKVIEASKLVPRKPQDEEDDLDLEMAMDLEPQLAAMARRFPEAFRHVNGIVGKAKSYSKHAAGVVISSRPVAECVPLLYTKDKDGGGYISATAYDMNSIERVGLVKYDFLGLGTLQAIQLTLELIRKRFGAEAVPNLEEIPLSDPEVFNVFARGRTATVFQFASEGMRNTLRDVRADSMEDLIAIVSLYRPGPMRMIPQYIKGKRNPDSVTHPHPICEKLLGTTYGIPVYQEQAMMLAREMAGFDWPEVDKMRKAVSKKDPVAYEKVCKLFREKAIYRGIDSNVIETVLFQLKDMAGYCFNRAHATGYSLLAYLTAYLLRYYPSEWYASCLYVDRSPQKKDAVALYREECRQLRMRILPPDVNTSGLSAATNQKGDILTPLVTIAGIGETMAQNLVIHQPYMNLTDLAWKARPNRKVIEVLADAKALGSLPDAAGQSTEQILLRWDEIVGTRNREEKRMAREETQGYRVVSPLAQAAAERVRRGDAAPVIRPRAAAPAAPPQDMVRRNANGQPARPAPATRAPALLRGSGLSLFAQDLSMD